MNEAAISTARNMKSEIEMEDIDQAIERMQLGLEKKGRNFNESR
jgi:ATP-dependent Zn protease